MCSSLRSRRVFTQRFSRGYRRCDRLADMLYGPTAEWLLDEAVREPSARERDRERDHPVLPSERPENHEVPEVEAVADLSKEDERRPG